MIQLYVTINIIGFYSGGLSMKRNFRKILLTVFAVTSLVMILAFSSSAKEYKSGNFIYNVGSKYAVLVEYTGKSKNVKIP